MWLLLLCALLHLLLGCTWLLSRQLDRTPEVRHALSLRVHAPHMLHFALLLLLKVVHEALLDLDQGVVVHHLHLVCVERVDRVQQLLILDQSRREVDNLLVEHLHLRQRDRLWAAELLCSYCQSSCLQFLELIPIFDFNFRHLFELHITIISCD